MKIRINHILKRLVSICTCLTFLISTICIPEIIAYAAESNFEKVTLSLNSNIVNDKSIDLYVQNSVYYITIEDLCKLTRCSKSVEDNMISVKQGIWDTKFNVTEQVFSDDYQTVDITILKVSQNKYAIPALMFLSYFKAMPFIENNTLYCTMSECTPWEALNVDYDNSLVNIYELYGGKGNVVLSLTLDIIMDFIMGNDLSSDGYMKDAYMEALNVDLYSCKAVKNYVESNTEHLYNDLESEKTIELLSVISTKQEYDSSNAESLLNISQPALEFYIDFVAQNQIREFYNLAFDALDGGDEITMNRYADQIAAVWKDGEAQKILTENKIKTVDGTLFLLSAAIEAAQQIKYAKQANNLVYRVMGQENLNKLNLDIGSNEWFQMANIYKSTSVALQDSVTNILDELQGNAINDLVSEAVKKIEIDSLTGIKTGEWAIALETARISVKFLSWIDSLVSDTWLDDVLTDVSAYKADRLALYLSELQQNVFLIVCNESNRLTNNLSEPDAYSDYIYAQQLYCRTSIAMYKNLICMVDEFGKNREYWKSLFQSRIDALAISLYQLTMIQDDGINECLPLDLTAFQLNSDSVEISSYLEQHEQLVVINQSKSLRDLQGAYKYRLDHDSVLVTALCGENGNLFCELEFEYNNYKDNEHLKFEWDGTAKQFEMFNYDQKRYMFTIELIDDQIKLSTQEGFPFDEVLLEKSNGLILANIVLAVENYFNQYEGTRLEKSDSYEYPTEGIYGTGFGELWEVAVSENGKEKYLVSITSPEFEVIGQASVYDYDNRSKVIQNGDFESLEVLETFSIYDYFDFE